MEYNFISKLRGGEFSLKEDATQTLRDVYQCTGLDFIVTKLEGEFGVLKETDKLLIEGAYASGTGLMISYFATGESYLGICSAACYSLGLLHHSAMGKKD